MPQQEADRTWPVRIPVPWRSVCHRLEGTQVHFLNNYPDARRASTVNRRVGDRLAGPPAGRRASMPEVTPVEPCRSTHCDPTTKPPHTVSSSTTRAQTWVTNPGCNYLVRGPSMHIFGELTCRFFLLPSLFGGAERGSVERRGSAGAHAFTRPAHGRRDI